GLTPKQISKKYFLSPRTIYKHMENIHQKLNVSSQQELLVKLLNKN
ncbi:MAG: DNA-binding response regulator, partial [Spirochaetes bacterium]|nr:DNA-binding response regulator [Spirochaetota bacterium]